MNKMMDLLRFNGVYCRVGIPPIKDQVKLMKGGGHDVPSLPCIARAHLVCFVISCPMSTTGCLGYHAYVKWSAGWDLLLQDPFRDMLRYYSWILSFCRCFNATGYLLSSVRRKSQVTEPILMYLLSPFCPCLTSCWVQG